MKSMTGFGNSEYSDDNGFSIKIDIVSYNKKQLDIRVILPKELMAFEHIVRKEIVKEITRGSVSVRVSINSNTKATLNSVNLDFDIAEAYKQKIEDLKKLGVSGELDINTLLNLPGVICEPDIEHLLDDEILKKVINKALVKLVEMRDIEGTALSTDIKNRVAMLNKLVDIIEPESEKIPRQQHKRLTENLKNAGLEIEINDERVLKEIIIFTDRYDISEEITRLRSHFNQFDGLLEKNEPVGRAMEFLVQEIQREINTLGNKAAHTAISPNVVIFKTELEKIREQVHNVE
jgi:uncharacterized protein (TIGR00255 family)